MEFAKRFISTLSDEGIQVFLLVSIVVAIALHTALREHENHLGTFFLFLGITFGVAFALIIAAILLVYWIVVS